ncbi:MAG TPA: glutamine synthetase III [Candidatus Edwardsbacteria bacterium]|nr:glutamine synthetase III [Candidatus Edwardsbacteria bacterium]
MKNGELNKPAVPTIPNSFGSNVFTDAAMKQYLPYKAYLRLTEVVRKGGRIDEQLAEEVAHGVKEWALARGATHYCHWFQPMTGATAEKHDSFLSYDAKGQPIARFSGKNLIQGEPDASSFPSGGIRATFEARGYTAWDPTSPIFVVENAGGATICIPTIFLSYTGEALDEKAPLLRSNEAVGKAALRVLRLFGGAAARVYPTVGAEQEYFLLDKQYFDRRPDLVLTGRTLFGARSPKDQQMEDHYFGTIKERILCFMQDAEAELYRLGIPAKTRHNEVAPMQFELATLYEESNIACDHNHLIMETMKKVALRHGFVLLLHEKPFAGVNGSGKHNNWSLADGEGRNLLEPGATPHDNLQFLVFLMAVVSAVHQYGDLLRAWVASAGNDHRLGASEAPPAIMSVFLGEQLTRILDNIAAKRQHQVTDQQIIDLGIAKLPVISRDNTDRNRTSPFAFTGSKFEFSAVGAPQSIAPANYTLNTIVAAVLDQLADAVEAGLQGGADLNSAVMAVLTEAIERSRPARYEGNNYEQAWEQEAARRGLSNKKTTPLALADLVAEKNVAAFVRAGVFTRRELEARHHIQLEKYCKTVRIEAETALRMVRTMILPACLEHQHSVSYAVSAITMVPELDQMAMQTQYAIARRYTVLVSELERQTLALADKLRAGDAVADPAQLDQHCCAELIPAMAALRRTVDALEEQSDRRKWPLPQYWEMMFVY